MQIEIRAEGDVVERTELLNGTVTVVLEGRSGDGVWAVSGVVSWNRGLVDYAGEGDITISSDVDELFATLTAASVNAEREEGDDGAIRLRLAYEIDGGAGRFEGASGAIAGTLRVEGERFDGEWKLQPAEG